MHVCTWNGRKAVGHYWTTVIEFTTSLFTVKNIHSNRSRASCRRDWKRFRTKSKLTCQFGPCKWFIFLFGLRKLQKADRKMKDNVIAV